MASRVERRHSGPQRGAVARGAARRAHRDADAHGDAPCEIIVVDDGSTDESFEILARLQARRSASARDPASAATSARRRRSPAGFDHARGRVIVTSDGDLQNDPRDIPAMVDTLERGYDIVCGWRKDRKDAFLSRRLPSMVANRLISVGDRRAPARLRLLAEGVSRRGRQAAAACYGEMHRFLPAIASEQGVTIREVVVNHRPRRYGRSKYGIGRTIRVVLDLLTVKFLLSYSTRPLQIFGLIGVAMGLIGVAISGWLAIDSCRHFDTYSLVEPAAAAARHPADFHRRTARHARTAGGTAGADVSRIAGQADVR